MTDRRFLGPLADPLNYREPLDLAGTSDAAAQAMLEKMLTVRLAEEAVAALVEAGEAVCPCHLGIGQEAVAVGVSSALRQTDRVYGGHRSHAHYLALGGSLFGMFAEILGRRAGVSAGMGGSMHLYAPEVGFHGSVPIVGATIPIAVGAALAAKMDGRGDIAIAYFGDGACEEGVLHESLNMAAIYKLPVLFVCENNLYSSHLDIKLRQPSDSVARFAEAHSVPNRIIDGNDVVAVARTAMDLIAASRDGGGPGFIEAVTYRWRGHVGPKEDVDVGVRRSVEQLNSWRERDPVRRLHEALVLRRASDTTAFEHLLSQIRVTIEQAVARARKASFPEEAALLDLVYAPRSV